MKLYKRHLLLIPVIFIISMILVSFLMIQLVLNLPALKPAFKRAKVSNTEIVSMIYGKDLPANEVKIINSMVSKDYKITPDSKSENSIIFIIVPAAVITFIFLYVENSIQNNRKRKKEEFDKKTLKENYIKKYPFVDKKAISLCIDGTSSYNDLINKKLIIWHEQNTINIINNDYTCDIGKIIININNILCFSRYGDFYTSTNIKGGDSSFSKAALGYFIAGGVGAMVASRNSVSSETIVHDNRETIIFIKEGNEIAHLFFEPDLYDYLMHIIPVKEMNNKIPNDINVERNYDKLVNLIEMKEKGLISEVEFIKLKNEFI